MTGTFKPRMEILQRAEAKDYRDIAAMVNAGVILSRGLSAARELYGLNFQPSESLKAMVYFEDGDLHILTKGEKNSLVKAVSEVRDLPHVAILDRQLTATACALSSDHDAEDCLARSGEFVDGCRPG